MKETIKLGLITLIFLPPACVCINLFIAYNFYRLINLRIETSETLCICFIPYVFIYFSNFLVFYL